MHVLPARSAPTNNPKMCRDTNTQTTTTTASSRSSTMNDARIPIYNPADYEDTEGSQRNGDDEWISTIEVPRKSQRGLPYFMTAMMGSGAVGSSVAVIVSSPLKGAFSGAIVVLLLTSALLLAPSIDNDTSVRLAIIGNSLIYFNDLPRLLEAMAQGRLQQESCLHGNADFSSHLWYGNGMYQKWQTETARIRDTSTEEQEGDPLYDFGACTVQELLFGEDERITEKWVMESASSNNATYGSQLEEWDYPLEDDGMNPCLMDESYKKYREERFLANGRPQWDFVLMNDNTRSPCCTEQRSTSMDLLETVYLPWLAEIEATPIFMVTYSYWASKRDMSGLTDIPTFASLTYNGYQDYYRLAEDNLPSHLKPRIAPVGLAFLMVWEENPSVWNHLMHYDEIHLSPSGSFLEACVVYHTIFGTLPDPSVYQGQGGPEQLWKYARRMDPVDDIYKAFPSRQVADYLYNIAARICVHKEIPKSLHYFPTNTSVNFTPDDAIYAGHPGQRGRTS